MSYFKTILVVFVLMLLAAPFFVSADDEKPVTCCKLRHTIDIDGNKIEEGSVVALGEIGADKDCTLSSSAPGADHPNVSNWAMYCSLDSIMVVADLIRWFAYVATGVIFLIAGIMFFMSGGNPEKMNTAKRFLFYGLIGAMIIILSNLIPSIGRFFIGG